MRRLVAKTLTQLYATAFEQACAPFQHALSTRAGTECMKVGGLVAYTGARRRTARPYIQSADPDGPEARESPAGTAIRYSEKTVRARHRRLRRAHFRQGTR